MANKQVLQSAGDGTAVPAGYVGEIKSSTTTTPITIGAVSLASIPLTPGVWTVSGGCRVGADSTSRYVVLSISTTSATHDAVTGRVMVANYYEPAGVLGLVSFPRTINISINTTVYLIGSMSSVSGLSGTESYFEAVRIA